MAVGSNREYTSAVKTPASKWAIHRFLMTYIFV